jgi:biopolymer transport protein ExbD
MPRWNLLVLVFFVAFGAAASSAQAPRLPPTISQTQGTGSVPVNSGGDDVQKQQAIAANQQRQIEIRRDTEKMAELTQELKEYLEKTDPGVLSADAVKKAEQIEKLARSVKAKMKQSF